MLCQVSPQEAEGRAEAGGNRPQCTVPAPCRPRQARPQATLPRRSVPTPRRSWSLWLLQPDVVPQPWHWIPPQQNAIPSSVSTKSNKNCMFAELHASLLTCYAIVSFSDVCNQLAKIFLILWALQSNNNYCWFSAGRGSDQTNPRTSHNPLYMAAANLDNL